MGHIAITLSITGADWEWWMVGAALAGLAIAGAIKMGVEAWATWASIKLAKKN